MTDVGSMSIGQVITHDDDEMITVKMGENRYIGISVEPDLTSDTVTVTIARAYMPDVGPQPDSWPTIEVQQIDDTIVTVAAYLEQRREQARPS